jgi:hydrogenase nickel insertion protein HypA
MAGELMGAVLSSIEGRSDIEGIDEVHVTVGKLSTVGEEQLRFCWEAITEDVIILKGSRLIITIEEGTVRCRSCGYEGTLDLGSETILHNVLPVFACPECKGSVDITGGRSVTVRNIRARTTGDEVR